MKWSLLLLLLFVSPVVAQTTVLIDGPNVYVIQGDRAIKADKVLRVEGGDTDPIPPTSDMAKEVKGLTDAVKNDESSKVILAALYEDASNKVRAGTWTVDKALQQIKTGSDALLSDSWKPWRTGVGKLLDDRARRGTLNADALAEVADGIKSSLAGLTFASKAERARFNRELLLKILPIVQKLLSGELEFDVATIIQIILAIIGS